MKTYQATFSSGAVRTLKRITSEPPWAWRWHSPPGEVPTEKYGTARTEAAAQVAAEKSVKHRFEQIHGQIPSPTFSPVSEARAAGFKDIKSYRRAKLAHQAAFVKAHRMEVALTICLTPTVH